MGPRHPPAASPSTRGSIYSPCQHSVGCERAERHYLVRKGGAWFGPAPPPSPRSSVKGAGHASDSQGPLLEFALMQGESLSQDTGAQVLCSAPALQPSSCRLLQTPASSQFLAPFYLTLWLFAPSLHLPRGNNSQPASGGPPFSITPGVQRRGVRTQALNHKLLSLHEWIPCTFLKKPTKISPLSHGSQNQSVPQGWRPHPDPVLQ